MTNIEKAIVKALVDGLGESAQEHGDYFDDDRAEGENVVVYDGSINLEIVARRIALAIQEVTR